MIKTEGKKNKYMKTLIILLALVIFSTASAYSKETIDCQSIKKTSPKYLLCKTKAAGSAIKNKLSKKSELKDKSGKKSIWKKFGEAKTLSDLN